MELFRSAISALLLSVASETIAVDCADAVRLGEHEGLCLSQEMVGEEFILTVSKIHRVSGSTIDQVKVDNAYAVLSPNAENVLFCSLANGWTSVLSFSILELKTFFIRPLRIEPEPIDEVICRFDTTGQVVVVFDEFPGRSNAHVYSVAGEPVAVVQADSIDRLSVNNRELTFIKGFEFGGVRDAF
jgi:hypothetical protein